jgi:hypothetical protein
MLAMLIYHSTKLLDFTSDMHSLYIKHQGTCSNKQKLHVLWSPIIVIKWDANACSSTYLYVGYWLVHHGELDLDKRRKIYNLTMREIECDKMYV